MMATSKRTQPAAARVERELEAHRQELSAQNEELRRANRDLTTVKERYAQLYDGAPMAYFTLDDDAMIVEVNLTGADLLGAPRAVLFGRVFDDLVAAASRASFRIFRRRLLAEGERLVHETTLAVGARLIPVRIEASRVASGPGEKSHCLLCVTDESQHRQREAEHRAMNAHAAEVTRVESLRTLAGSVAHDLNDMLAGVLTHADLLLGGGVPAPEAQDLVRHIREAAIRAADLSSKMSAYCGQERLHAEPLDVSALIAAMQGRLARVAPPNVTHVVELAEGLPLVIGDRARLEQVVLNLVVNAVESIAPAAGRIVLRTRACGSSASAEPVSCRGGVVIECADDGRGMDARTAQRAFDPFFTTKRMSRGLGLALVQGTVRAHGGVVTVASQPDKGTTVRVFLPAALAGSPANAN